VRPSFACQQKAGAFFGTMPEAVNQGGEIILDFVTDNK
jgi:hypothetical protein